MPDCLSEGGSFLGLSSVFLSVSLPVSLSVSQSVCLSVCLSVSQSFGRAGIPPIRIPAALGM